jgi:ubiquinone/menaquinone biosynthesis C-methylase UbiE
MNIVHRWYCNSEAWGKMLHEQMLPGALRGIDLGDDLLEVGPGPGKATDWLRERAPHVTSIEIDTKLATALRARMQHTNVTVVEGDATAMPFPDAAFTSAVCFTMLHHVPAKFQGKLLEEVARVLRPGAWFVGGDSIPSLTWNLFHLFDDRNPVDPATFVERLKRAGFVEAQLTYQVKSGFGWSARRA